MMKHKIGLALTLVSVLVLAACGQQTPAATATLTAEPTVTSAPAATLPAGEATGEPGAVSGQPATCSVVSMLPTPGPTEVSLFPPPTEEDWSEGPADAEVTFMEYSDFQCPYCSALAEVLKQLHQDYPDDVRVIFRHFPLSGHDKALQGAEAAEAAGLQGKFWEMHDVLFENQDEWALMTADDFDAWLLEQAEALDLDMDQFEADYTSDEIAEKITTAQERGAEIGIPGTPFMLVNGLIYYQRPRDYASLSGILNLFKLEDRQYTACPPTVIDSGKDYIATLHTEKGDVVIQLYDDVAPVTVNSFVFLAQDGWFDNVPFHRVMHDFVAQAGDPSGTGYGGPGYFFDNEIDSSLMFDKPGVVGMANSGPTSNGSQFFITYAAAPDLDGSYTIFGQVTEGMDVLQQITERNPDAGGDLPEGDKILSIDIEEN
ncbi:MAG: peptidylprolyl isomerase [Anaerolineaceae bacterium]|nr:peptidylprolyl isomerase [Anaerolineaceae bacterium]